MRAREEGASDLGSGSGAKEELTGIRTSLGCKISRFGSCLETRVEGKRGLGESNWIAGHWGASSRGQSLREEKPEFSFVLADLKCLSHVRFSCRNSPRMFDPFLTNPKRLNNIVLQPITSCQYFSSALSITLFLYSSIF